MSLCNCSFYEGWQSQIQIIYKLKRMSTSKAKAYETTERNAFKHKKTRGPLHKFRSPIFKPLYELFICYGHEEYMDLREPEGEQHSPDKQENAKSSSGVRNNEHFKTASNKGRERQNEVENKSKHSEFQSVTGDTQYEEATSQPEFIINLRLRRRQAKAMQDAKQIKNIETNKSEVLEVSPRIKNERQPNNITERTMDLKKVNTTAELENQGYNTDGNAYNRMPITLESVAKEVQLTKSEVTERTHKIEQIRSNQDPRYAGELLNLEIKSEQEQLPNEVNFSGHIDPVSYRDETQNQIQQQARANKSSANKSFEQPRNSEIILNPKPVTKAHEDVEEVPVNKSVPHLPTISEHDHDMLSPSPEVIRRQTAAAKSSVEVDDKIKIMDDVASQIIKSVEGPLEDDQNMIMQPAQHLRFSGEGNVILLNNVQEDLRPKRMEPSAFKKKRKRRRSKKRANTGNRAIISSRDISKESLRQSGFNLVPMKTDEDEYYYGDSRSEEEHSEARDHSSQESKAAPTQVSRAFQAPLVVENEPVPPSFVNQSFQMVEPKSMRQNNINSESNQILPDPVRSSLSKHSLERASHKKQLVTQQSEDNRLFEQKNEMSRQSKVLDHRDPSTNSILQEQLSREATIYAFNTKSAMILNQQASANQDIPQLTKFTAPQRTATGGFRQYKRIQQAHNKILAQQPNCVSQQKFEANTQISFNPAIEDDLIAEHTAGRAKTLSRQGARHAAQQQPEKFVTSMLKQNQALQIKMNRNEMVSAGSVPRHLKYPKFVNIPRVKSQQKQLVKDMMARQTVGPPYLPSEFTEQSPSKVGSRSPVTRDNHNRENNTTYNRLACENAPARSLKQDMKAYLYAAVNSDPHLHQARLKGSLSRQKGSLSRKTLTKNGNNYQLAEMTESTLGSQIQPRDTGIVSSIHAQSSQKRGNQNLVHMMRPKKRINTASLSTRRHRTNNRTLDTFFIAANLEYQGTESGQQSLTHEEKEQRTKEQIAAHQKLILNSARRLQILQQSLQRDLQQQSQPQQLYEEIGASGQVEVNQNVTLGAQPIQNAPQVQYIKNQINICQSSQNSLPELLAHAQVTRQSKSSQGLQRQRFSQAKGDIQVSAGGIVLKTRQKKQIYSTASAQAATEGVTQMNDFTQTQQTDQIQQIYHPQANNLPGHPQQQFSQTASAYHHSTGMHAHENLPQAHVAMQMPLEEYGIQPSLIKQFEYKKAVISHRGAPYQ